MPQKAKSRLHSYIWPQKQTVFAQFSNLPDISCVDSDHYPLQAITCTDVDLLLDLHVTSTGSSDVLWTHFILKISFCFILSDIGGHKGMLFINGSIIEKGKNTPKWFLCQNDLTWTACSTIGILQTKILTLAHCTGRSENMEFVYFYVTPCKTQKERSLLKFYSKAFCSKTWHTKF